MMADLLGWGKMFMGIILMAFVTSLPELMTGISSVTFIDAPDLAVGNIVGSCAYNILIISVLDFFLPKKPITSMVQTGHIIAASFSIVLLSMLGYAILMPDVFGTVYWIGGFSMIFIAMYMISMRVVFLYEKKQPAVKGPDHKIHFSLKQVITRFVCHAFVVMGAALLLPYFGEQLAEASGLGESFFGTLFVALTTVLPEIVVSIAAIRLGTIDMAMGNLFGSNIFNIGILAIDDIFYTKGPLFQFTSQNHIIPVMSTIIITAIGIIGIVFKSTRKWKLAIDTAAIVIVYILMLILLYQRK
jgi:cation:H+ antiporter